MLPFTPTSWQDGVTPVSAGNMNHIEQAILNIWQALRNVIEVGGTLQLPFPQTAPAAPTIADSGNAGNLNGKYDWVVVLITGFQRQDGSYFVTGFAPSADSSQLTVTNHSINLTNIAIGTSVIIGRAIYRTAAGGAAGTEKFVGVIWDNSTTTFIDNIADALLGTGMPTTTSLPAVYGTAIPASVPTGNTTGTFLNNGPNTNYVAKSVTPTYNASGTLTTLTHKDGAGRTIRQDAFTYDNNGNCTQEQYTSYSYPDAVSTTPSSTTLTTVTHTYDSTGTWQGATIN